MEKDFIYQIKDKLSDIPDGTCISIRHPLSGSSVPVTVTETAVSSGVRLRTESYELYPGIELSYHDYLGDRFHFCHSHSVSVLSIDHCRYGRIGWEMQGGLSLYFGSGDLSFHLTDKCSDSEISLPLGCY